MPTVAGSAQSSGDRVPAAYWKRPAGSFTPSDGTIIRPVAGAVRRGPPQTTRSAKSVVQCIEREEALAGGILHLCGPGRVISAFANLTVIRPGDMADRVCGADEHAGVARIRDGCCPGRRGCDRPDGQEADPAGHSDSHRARSGTRWERSTAASWRRVARARRRRPSIGVTSTSWITAQERRGKSASLAVLGGRVRHADVLPRSRSMLAELQNDPEENAAAETFVVLDAPAIAESPKRLRRGRNPSRLHATDLVPGRAQGAALLRRRSLVPRIHRVCRGLRHLAQAGRDVFRFEALHTNKQGGGDLGDDRRESITRRGAREQRNAGSATRAGQG